MINRIFGWLFTLAALAVVACGLGITEVNKQIDLVLEEQNLEYGFSTFWHAHTTTIISDSNVRIINTDINENGITPCPFQTDMKWFEPEGVDRVFLLCTGYELTTLSFTEDWKYIENGPIERLEFEGFHIFVFDNTDFLY